jgi:hypothetical protein
MSASGLKLIAYRHIGKPPESVSGKMEELGFIYGAG